MPGLSLKQQCYLLAGLPLLLEFACVVALLLVQHKAQEELEKTSHSRQIVQSIYNVNNMYQGMKLSKLNAPNFVVAHPNSFFEAVPEYKYVVSTIPSELKRLLKLVAYDAEASESIQRLIARYEAMLPSLKRWPLLLGLQTSDPDLLSKAQPTLVPVTGENRTEFIQTELNMLALEHDVIESLASIKEKAIPGIKKHQRGKTHSDQQMENIIYLMMLGNILLALALAAYFYRNTIARLNTLIENSNRLRFGESLVQGKEDSDELGILDKSFHLMARTLRETARKNSAMIRNSMDVLMSLDETGRCIDVSPSAGKMFERHPNTLIGDPIASILLKKDAERFPAELTLAKTRSAHTFEMATSSLSTKLRSDATLINNDGIQPVDGVEVPVEAIEEKKIDLMWTVRWSEDSKQYFCVAHDISNRKKIELIRQEIVQMVSHDLRSPLTNLLNHQETLEETTLPKLNVEGQKYFEKSNRDIDKMLGLINDLLDFEKVKAGMMELQIKSVTVDELIEEALADIFKFEQRERIIIGEEEEEEEVKEEVKLQDHKLEKESHKSELHESELHETELQETSLNIDNDLIARVLTNLLLNALSRSPANSEVKLFVSRSSAGNIKFSIEDVGGQISNIEKEKIEYIFNRASATKLPQETEETGTDGRTTEQIPSGELEPWTDGNSFRFSLCKALVESHAGTIGLRNTDRGAIFWFELPASRVANSEAAPF